MSDDMDINAGTVVDGTETLEQVENRIFEKILAVAGGEMTKSEKRASETRNSRPGSSGPTF
jgi:altronate dehydratase